MVVTPQRTNQAPEVSPNSRSQSSQTRLPVTVVTGFLGAGKSTLFTWQSDSQDGTLDQTPTGCAT